MRRIFIIGIGAGDPRHLTLEAIEALNRTDVIFIFDKGEEKSDLIRLRTGICERFARPGHRIVAGPSPEWSSRSGPDYGAVVNELNARKEALSDALIARETGEEETGAFLVWGDPALYDSTIRIVERIAGKPGSGLEYEVIPGISSIQALTARHRIAMNTIGGAVQITTGRRLAAGLPQEASSIVVMLDAEGAFLSHRNAGLDIYYGAYVGMPDERLFAGPLEELADEIHTFRQAARERKGWIMDSYLLRRREG